jgi:ATP-dependent DNA helicase RecQ
LSPEERQKVEKGFYRGYFQFLFIAPERFQIIEFRRHMQTFVSRHPIAYAVIDEAHCVSEWGHDFRTAYLLLSRTIRNYCAFKGQPPPIYALTGTASAVVLKDVKMDLGIGDGEDDSNAIITPSTFDRPELEFYICKCPSSQKYQELNQILRNISSEFNIDTPMLFSTNGSATKSGLVFAPHVNSTSYSINHLKSKIGSDQSFCLNEPQKICPQCGSSMLQKTTRNGRSRYFWGCEKYPKCTYTSNLLRTDEPRHFMNLHIYAGTCPDNFGEEAWEKYKIRAQNEFINNKASLMLTTKAFGMGIDKPNIRYTIHYCLPPSIESFYQEAGRAGRDRQKAFCALIFSDDNAKDADKRLDPNLSMDDILKLPKVRFNGEGDIHRNLYFQAESFKGKMSEYTILKALFKVPFNIWLNRLKIGEEFSGPVYSQNIIINENKQFIDPTATEKALYRYLIIGLIDDYTIDFKARPRVFNVNITRRNDEHYALQLYHYLSKHKADFLSVYPSNDKFFEYLKARPEEHIILQCLGELLDFIYSEMEPKRRQALTTLVQAVRPGDSQYFRKEILRYFESDDKYNQLFWIFPQSTELAEWITILEKAEDEETTNKLLGICLRNLESYPTSVGLRFIAASLRLSISNEKEEYAIADFMAGLLHLKNNYVPEQIEKIFSYFVFFILEKSKYPKANLSIAKLLLNEYHYSKYAIKLFQGDLDEDIRKLGAAYILRQIKAPLSQLLTHLKG